MNRVKQNPWAIVLVALLPVLVLGILLAALWNPMDRLDTVPAAIVNNDEPVEVDGQTAPLGRQLAAGLVEGGTDDAEGSDVNYDWTVTDAEHATEGLADGTYAAVVTIPEEFSAAATSFGGDDAADARQATIDISTPPGGRVVDDALARIVATTATTVMGSTLTETYVDNVLIGFDQLSDGIGQAADGADQLASGAGDAADGADELSDGAGQLSDGAAQLADGATDASSGASQLAGGAGELAGGADQAAAGASELAGGAGQVVAGATGLSQGASQLADGAGQVAAGAKGITGGITESARGADDLADGGYALADGADQVADGVGRLADQVGAVNDDLPGTEEIEAGLGEVEARLEGSSATVETALDEASTALGCDGAEVPDPAACERVADAQAALAGASEDFVDEFNAASTAIVDARGQLTGLAEGTSQLAQGAEEVAVGTRGIADGNAELADGLDELADGNRQVAAGASGVADGADELATGAGQLATGASGISSGASGLADGVGQLATGASGISSGASGLADGVGQLGSGASELATGTDGLADGASGLADGVDQVAGGADDLADGLQQTADGIPTYSDSDRENLASVVADPVAAPGVDDLTTGATGPLFAVVALWLGALGLMTVLPPVAARALGSTRSALRLTLGTLAVPAAVGAGTGAAVGAVLAGVEGLSPVGWVGTILLGALVSVSFVAVHLGFLAWLGNVGRGISLLIAVLMIGTGVVATVPAVLVSVADALPTGAARDALAAAVVPEVGGLGGAVTAVVLWGLVGLGLGVGAAARARRTRVATLLRA
ncbi:putative membrane protein [Isoptericola sp. CG 20/1183]|uniref:Membrane protein n=1 Tax=Isoptericola halotolerans TaxID=300560 RepID=A0ABX5ELT4_9MICO|nr:MULTISPECIES: YhgE/Pip domain-containing protein [Isoptericola]PRZ09313.1 putative membrane protein [Isoptericola sp. CG 20/1183]PRZ10114.1 putative membrane protein [Isoptericola halotolerans]